MQQSRDQETSVTKHFKYVNRTWTIYTKQEKLVTLPRFFSQLLKQWLILWRQLKRHPNKTNKSLFITICCQKHIYVQEKHHTRLPKNSKNSLSSLSQPISTVIYHSLW